jgi:hypothetical protein
MTDHLEVAQRRYEQIRSRPGQRSGFRHGAELSLWLDTEVCQIVEEIIQRPDFRERARWPIVRLADVASGKERKLVNAMDVALRKCARNLAAVAEVPSLRQALLQLGPHNELLPTASTEGCESSGSDSSGNPVPLGLTAITALARRPWRDLASTRDYFHPVSDLNLREEPGSTWSLSTPSPQWAAFLPYFNVRLRPLGDFLSRMLLLRIEHWQSQLKHFSVRCQIALQLSAEQSEQSDSAHLAAAVESLRQIDEVYEELKDRCLTSQAARERNACIALLQVYACYRPQADLTWLGLPKEWTVLSRGIRHWVEQRTDESLGEQIAAALLDVGSSYRAAVDVESLIEEKRRLHTLVVVIGAGRREVHWRGERIECEWTTQEGPWIFLSTLAERAKSRLGIDAFTNGDKGPSPLKDWRYRLKKLLPATLNEQIKPAGQGTYKLALRPDEVCILGFEESERVVEVLGR